MSDVLKNRKSRMTSVRANIGATSHVMNTGPKPERKGGTARDVPPFMHSLPGNTNAAPTVLATAHTAGVSAAVRRAGIPWENCSVPQVHQQPYQGAADTRCPYLFLSRWVLKSASIKPGTAK